MIVAWTPDTMGISEQNESEKDDTLPAKQALRCTIELLQLFSKPDLISPTSSISTNSNTKLSPNFNINSSCSSPTKEVIDSIDCRLSIHIGLGFGELERAHVGIPGIRRECFLEGRALRDASECLDKAAKGEFCLTREAVDLLLGKEACSGLDFWKGSHGIDDSNVVVLNRERGFELFWKLLQQNTTNVIKTTGAAESPNVPRMKLSDFAEEYINESMARLLKESIQDQNRNINMLRKMSVVFIKVDCIVDFSTWDDL
jgi:hypothetical protein